MEQVFSKGHDCKAKIIESFRSAKSEIKVAMAYFTDRDIGEELTQASKRNVIVSVILSKDVNNETILELLSDHCELYVHGKSGWGIMHHKFSIIDNNLLLHGSYNYTYNALRNNDETLVATQSRTLIDEYTTIYDDLLGQIKNNKPMETEVPKLSNDPDYLERFTDELKNHISQIFDNFDKEEISGKGQTLSKDSEGSEAVFINYLDSTLSEVNSILNQNDQVKVLVKTRMTNSLDRAIETNSEELENKIKLVEQSFLGKKEQITSELDILKERKKEKNNNHIDERTELSKIEATINEIEDEIDSLDRQIVVTSFWKFPTVFKLFLMLLFIPYLCLFFGSAIWKIFFEEAIIMQELNRGITPQTPTLFDANALAEIYSTQGIFYTIIATIFFIIPVILSNIKLLAPKNKAVEIIVGWILGIFIIDIVVSLLISQHTFEIRKLVTGGSGVWSFEYALKSAEFWLIFIFGALPLLITKFIVSSIWTAYNNSDSMYVDREKTLLRNSLKRRKVATEQKKLQQELILESLNEQIKEIVSEIEELDAQMIEVSRDENDKILELKENNEKRNNSLKEIYNSFVGSVDSGNKLFLKNVISGRITAFKQGFFLHLTSYFSQLESTRRINRLEEAHKNWIKLNFE